MRALRLLLLPTIALIAACDPAPPVDHYILALSWQPAFCERNAGRPECRDLDRGDFAATNLSLHGLWPNGAGDDHPFYCAVAAADRNRDQDGDWCGLSATGADRATQRDLAQLMPGSQSCLDRHEWIKHGTCTGLGGDAYFDAAVRLVLEVQTTQLSERLRAAIGKTVSLRVLLEAFERDFGGGAVAALEITCRRNGGRAYLAEIRVALRPEVIDKPLSPSLLFLDGPAPKGNCPAEIFIDPVG